MGCTIRTAGLSDLDRVTEIYAYARNFMAQNGNPSQWGANYPEPAILLADIRAEHLYVVTDERGIHGAFYFAVEEDPTYAEIFQGSWHSDRPYGVIHRIAGDGSGGILSAAVAFAAKHCDHLRIDTHADNHIMQRAITKQGFTYCGIIYVEDGTPRLAYDKVTAGHNDT